MLNPLEKLLDVYRIYDYDFMSTRQNFLNTLVHQKLVRTNRSRLFYYQFSMSWSPCAWGWWVVGPGMFPGEGPAGCNPLQVCGVHPVRREQGRQAGLAAGLPHHGSGRAVGRAVPCWGAWLWLGCPRSAGPAIRAC